MSEKPQRADVPESTESQQYTSASWGLNQEQSGVASVDQESDGQTEASWGTHKQSEHSVRDAVSLYTDFVDLRTTAIEKFVEATEYAESFKQASRILDPVYSSVSIVTDVATITDSHAKIEDRVLSSGGVITDIVDIAGKFSEGVASSGVARWAGVVGAGLAVYNMIDATGVLDPVKANSEEWGRDIYDAMHGKPETTTERGLPESEAGVSNQQMLTPEKVDFSNPDDTSSAPAPTAGISDPQGSDICGEDGKEAPAPNFSTTAEVPPTPESATGTAQSFQVDAVSTSSGGMSTSDGTCTSGSDASSLNAGNASVSDATSLSASSPSMSNSSSASASSSSCGGI